MARPRKPASLKHGHSESKEQLRQRDEAEKELLGSTDKIKDVPEHLDDLAKQYYVFLTTELEISDILSNLDIPLLEQTSDCLSKIRQADSYINRNGLIITELDRYGIEREKENPAVATKQKYLNQFRALSTQLGLSPASRATLAGLKVEEENNSNDALLQILRG